MGCSEYRANTLLAEAKVLHRMGALEPMRQGLMTVEQARLVADVTRHRTFTVRLRTVCAT